MGAAKRFLARLWFDEHGISSVEYALLLAMIAGGIVMGADLLGGAVSNQLSETALWFGDTVGNNCGSEGGAGSGGGNTCQ